ncbi:MAG: GDP-mannose 4,6-dehydratase [Euryarchaeota archaeon]|nr:GDP-mannose 4,6-dehydratase [Euryarchaeota archaeon]
MSHYFVTGGTGFIGMHLLPLLSSRGEVQALVQDRPGRFGVGVKNVRGDVLIPHSLLSARRAKVIIHMAAISAVGAVEKNPSRAAKVNVEGTLNLLEQGRRNEKLGKFVFMSSGQVYGRIRYSPIDERHPLEPTNLYGATKAAADRLVHGYSATYGLPTVVLRAFNVYGPKQPPPFLIPSLISQLRRHRVPPTLGDGRLIRDFTFVDDFVRLVAKATEGKRGAGETFNVGTGAGASLDQVATILMQLAGAAGKPKHDRSRFRSSEARRLVVNSAKAKRTFGWKPRVTLRQGLATTWRASAPHGT